MESASWSTQRLTQLLVGLSAVPDEPALLRQVAEQAAEALEAEVGAVVQDGRVLAGVGFAREREDVARLVDVRSGDVLDVPGAGPCDVLAVEVPGPLGDGRLVVARSGGAWTQDERGLLRAMGRVAGLQRQSLHVLSELQERQALLERLARIQRSISTRAPLEDVLDTIVAGAAELLGEDIVALRLLDPDDETSLVIASSVGVPLDLVAGARRTRVTEGVGGQAVREDRLVVSGDYGSSTHHLRGFVGDGIRSVMAVPVRQAGRPVGSLTIASRREGRTYTASEQEALVALAEHAGLALNDARTVQALHRAVDEATHQALHDGLTGLPNRVLFLDRLQHALARSSSSRGSARDLAVLFIDVDDFKKVNDGLGHLVGDRLLTEVGERTCAAVRGADTVARLGGDEFAVLLEDVDLDEAVRTGERVLRRLEEPFAVTPDRVVHVAASVGLVVGGRGAERAEELLRDADVAMYHAKGAGKGRVVVFEHGMRLRLQARNELEAELRTALDEAQLQVHYQPVVDLVGRRVVGVEALLRWDHPRRGAVPPGEFVPVAEDTGLIVAAGRAALQEACRRTAGWDADGLALGVSVNLSPRQLQEHDLVDDVAQALAASGLAPHRLTLEITESLLVQDVATSSARLAALKALGVRLAVDDFGTGYSSLGYLSRLPVDVLKVDRSFVAGVTDGGSRARLTGAVLALAGSLELDAVAEGVETVAQARALLALGASVVQGFAYSPAVPAAQVPAVVRAVEAQLLGGGLQLVPAQARSPEARIS